MAGRSSILILFLFLSVAARAAEKDPKEEPDFKARVNAAVGKGLQWLLQRQVVDGRFPPFEDARGDIFPLGMHALSTLAVIKCDHPLESKELRSAFRALFALADAQQYTLKTYEAALTLMVLDAKYTTQPLEDRDQKRPPKKVKVEPEDRELARRMLLFLQTKQADGGLWRYPEEGQDLSNTQYALLGLWSASRLGLEVNRGVVRRALETTLQWQQADGPVVPRLLPSPDRRYGAWMEAGKDRARGWRYMPDFERTVDGGLVEKVTYPYSGSMTSAGIAILAIGREILGKDTWLTPERDRQVRQSMFDGFAWIGRHFQVADNPGQPGNWPFYWIYGLERAARLAAIEYVGQHDWYFEGAAELLNNQKPDGSWPLRQRMRPPKDANVRWWSDQVDTAFALLFLTRSTPQLKIPPPVTSGG